MFSAKRIVPAAGGVLTASIILMRLVLSDSNLPAASTWLTNTSLSLQKLADVSSPTSTGNVDCYSTDNSGCITETNYGEADSTGSVRLRNSKDYYPIYSQI